MSSAATVAPDAILKDLAKLWVSLAKEKEERAPGKLDTGSGVLRAISMTLLAAVDESEDPADVGETIALLMKEHPSRAIILRLVAGDGRVLSSRVYAQCWMPFGQRRQICCEQIEITASECAVEDLPGVVLPLTVPDLPIILWCRSAHMLSLPAFSGIAAVATKVIIDGDAFHQAGAQFQELRKLLADGRLVADLAWTRITRWREAVSRAMEIGDFYQRMTGTVDVIVEHENTLPRDGAYYFAAWLANSLEKCGATVNVKLQAADHALAGLCSVTLRLANSGEIVIRADGEGLEVSASGNTSRSVYPKTNDYALLQEELSLPAHDPVFEAALRRAIQMSQS